MSRNKMAQEELDNTKAMYMRSEQDRTLLLSQIQELETKAINARRARDEIDQYLQELYLSLATRVPTLTPLPPRERVRAIIDDVNAEYQKLYTMVQRYDQLFEQHNAEITALREQNDGLRRETEDLIEQRAHNAERSRQLQQQVDELQEKLADTTELETLRRNVNDLTAQNKSMESKIAELERDKESAEKGQRSTNQTLSKKTHEYEAQISDLRAKIHELELQIASKNVGNETNAQVKDDVEVDTYRNHVVQGSANEDGQSRNEYADTDNQESSQTETKTVIEPEIPVVQNNADEDSVHNPGDEESNSLTPPARGEEAQLPMSKAETSVDAEIPSVTQPESLSDESDGQDADELPFEPSGPSQQASDGQVESKSHDDEFAVRTAPERQPSSEPSQSKVPHGQSEPNKPSQANGNKVPSLGGQQQNKHRPEGSVRRPSGSPNPMNAPKNNGAHEPGFARPSRVKRQEPVKQTVPGDLWIREDKKHMYPQVHNDIQRLLPRLKPKHWYIMHVLGAYGVSTREDIGAAILEHHKTVMSDADFSRMISDFLEPEGYIQGIEITGATSPKFIAYELSKKGMTVYSYLFDEPLMISEVLRLTRDHDNPEHGYFIKETKKTMEQSLGYTNVTMDRNSNTIRIGERQWIPDIIATAPDGKKIYVEAEHVNHTQANFNDKCNKAIQVTKELYFVVKDKDAMDKMREQIDRWYSLELSKNNPEIQNVHFWIATNRVMQRTKDFGPEYRPALV